MVGDRGLQNRIYWAALESERERKSVEQRVKWKAEEEQHEKNKLDLMAQFQRTPIIVRLDASAVRIMRRVRQFCDL